MRRLITIILSIAAICSCELRPLYIEGETPVNVVVITDWTQLGGNPEGSSIYFYPETGAQPYVFKTNSVTRTLVQVPSGYYTVMVFNRTVDEYGTMKFDGMNDFASARSILEDKLFSWPGRADTVGRTVYEPEEIVVGRNDHFYVRTLSEYETEVGSGADGGNTSVAIVDSVLSVPRRMIYTGTVSIRVKGIQNLRSVRGYLTGMAGTAYLSTRSAGDSLATHVLESWKMERDEADYTKGYIRSTFNCMGIPEQYLGHQTKMNNKLVLQFMLVDNKTIIQEIRYVGDDIYQNKSELTVDVVVDGNAGVVLPDVKPEGGSESGFDVNFTDWGDDIDIPVGI